MNIKRIYTITLCLCLSVLMTSVCFAVNLEEFAFYADDGTLQYDFDAYHYRLACDYVAESGYDLEPDDYWVISPVTGDYIGYDWDSFCKDYDALSATNVSNEIIELSVAPAEEDDTYDLSDVGSDGPVSVVLEDNQFNTLVELETDIPHQYVVDDLRVPVVDPSVFSWDWNTDIPLLDLGYIPYYKISNATPSKEQFRSGYISGVFYGEYGEGNIGTLIDDLGLFRNLTSDHHLAYYCEIFMIVYEAPYELDLFGGIVFPETGIYTVTPDMAAEYGLADITITIPNYTGFGGVDSLGTLKSVVTTIFGDYEPVMTTDIILETADNVTTTTLIDVVASGAAGVDWEWCAGVLLFGIMLYCLFKLLGGILS